MSGKKYSFQVQPFSSDLWKELKKGWKELYENSKQQNVFYGPLFMEVFLLLQPSSRPTHLVLGFDGDKKWIFALPIKKVKDSFGLYRADFFTIPEEGFDHLAPLDCSPELEATRAFLKGFDPIVSAKSLGGWSVSDAVFAGMRSLRESERFHFFKRKSFRCPYIRLPSNQEDLILRLSHNSRNKLRRMLKKTEAQGIKFRVITESSHFFLTEALDRLNSLHSLRTQVTHRSSKFMESFSRDFHQKLCEQGSQFPGVIHFFELNFEGETIASLYGFLSKGRFCFYQSGFDPAFSKYSIGEVLLYKIMCYWIDKRVSVFDFLRGMDPYKEHWTQEVETDYFFSLGVGFGGLTVEKLRLQRAIKRNGKRLGVYKWLVGKD